MTLRPLCRAGGRLPGIFGFSRDQATRIAVGAVREDGARHGDRDITFACFDQAMLDLYRKEMAS